MVDRGKRGLKRSVAVDGGGIPLGWLTAPANRHDSPLVPGILERVEALGLLLDGARVHLDGGYDSGTTASGFENSAWWGRSPREASRPRWLRRDDG